MPTYEFVCPGRHRTDRVFSMAEVPGTIDCPECSIRARRVIGAPHLSRSGAAGFAAIDTAARSAHEPEVVRSTYPGNSAVASVTHNPLHQRLPRD